MTHAVAQLLQDADKLSASERAELTDHLVAGLARDIPEDVAEAQMAEVCRRIEEVESGRVATIPGEEALAQVRRLVAEARSAS